MREARTSHLTSSENFVSLCSPVFEELRNTLIKPSYYVHHCSPSFIDIRSKATHARCSTPVHW
jgi:hypothetical protein